MTVESQARPAPYPKYDGTQPCRQAPDLFFAENSFDRWYGGQRAVGICRPCPFIKACLAYALTHDVRGVWGGTHYQHRKQLREQYGITAVPVYLPDTVLTQIDIDRLDRGGGSQPAVSPPSSV